MKPVIRFFKVPTADLAPGKRFFLAPHLAIFEQGMEVAKVDGFSILKIVIGNRIRKYIKKTTGLTDILTLEAVVQLGLADYYIGETVEGVLTMYPELEGQEQFGVDEEGNQIMRNKIQDKLWAGIG